MNTSIPKKSRTSSTRLSLYAGGLGFLLTLAYAAAGMQQRATVRQILAGTMLPDDEVATFEHSETLYPFSRVLRKGPVRQLPPAANQLTNVISNLAARITISSTTSPITASQDCSS